MKKTAINIFTFVFAAILVTVNANAVVAAPRLTLTPVSGSYTNGSTFAVSIGVNSETEKSSAVDVWATFDKTKLEVVSIIKSTNPPFAFEMTPKFDNTAGTFQFSCISTNMSAFDDAVINGELAVVTFKTKAVGTAALNFTCTSGSTTDSNIFNSDINDVISCDANSVGSYTITGDSTATTTTTTTTPTPTTTLTPTGTVTATLPQTGAMGATVGLIVFGAISLASALFLKIL
ncbi:MAG: cohesin domain-containing protein [Candidatus Shapirobacteria bacterium]|nr:cohesin domain-containing protein [Candidatus Shapirobacteria bacterium]MDD3002251.1 cohesin domain-containing protein [Candidatus Shapirobacteria bacterium]MDD4382744.1 cohesin domain-containing protein [Candidatus Shapirobacteria bacterium]